MSEKISTQPIKISAMAMCQKQINRQKRMLNMSEKIPDQMQQIWTKATR